MRHADVARVGDSDSELDREWSKATARGLERGENEQIWAHYRLRDISQREAAEASIDDPEKVPGQSQVSRIVRSVDRDICYNCVTLGELVGAPWHTFKYVEWEQGLGNNPLSPIGKGQVGNWPEPFVEAIKDLTAETILRYRALKELSTLEHEPAEWAAEWAPDAIANNHLQLRTQLALTLGWDTDEHVDLAPDIKRNLRAESQDSAHA